MPDPPAAPLMACGKVSAMVVAAMVRVTMGRLAGLWPKPLFGKP